jgi:hypothetical protein
MNSDTDSTVAVDVAMPAALFTDLDAYAVAHGYRNTDAVVAEAIARHA